MLPRVWHWSASKSLVLPPDLPGISTYSIKDPTVVRFEDEWHLFCTVRGRERSRAVVYLRFADWDDANEAERHALPMHNGFFCAPQVFYYRPHAKWYLICQASDASWTPEYGAAFSTSDDLSDPAAWTPLKPLGLPRTPDDKAGLDFWIICDEEKAHLFFSTLDGRMWRSETSRDAFPHDWSEPQIAREGDIFKASHTYKPTGRWTDNISHGELLRTNYDEAPTVDAASLRFLFQGVLDADREGKPYGKIPWRLGVLDVQTNHRAD